MGQLTLANYNDIVSINNTIGSLSSLTTNDNSSIVNAINAVNVLDSNGNITLSREGTGVTSPNVILNNSDTTLGTTSSNTHYASGVYFTDANGDYIGNVRARIDEDGKAATMIGSRYGDLVQNHIAFTSTASSAGIAVSHPTAWYNGLELNTITLTNNYTAGSSVTVTNFNYYQSGRVAQIYLRWTNKTAISVPANNGNTSDYTVITLNAGYRPVHYVTWVSNFNQPSFACYGAIDPTSGNVTCAGYGHTSSARTIGAGTVHQMGVTFLLPARS